MAGLIKQIFLLIFLALGLCGHSQVTVTVSPTDTTVCYRDSAAFRTLITGAGAGKITYRWQKNYIDLTGLYSSDSIYAIPVADETAPGLYRCIVSAEGAGSDTSNDVLLRMHPRMYIDTLYRYNPLGCPGECKGQFKALVSGGTPFTFNPFYIYDWHGGKSQDTIVFGLCPGHYKLTVTDSLGCPLDSTYFVDVLKSPKVTFEIQPDSVVYLTNPNISVSFNDTNTRHITNWTWDFGDSVSVANLNPAPHTYSRTGDFKIKLTFTDLNGCDTTIMNIVTVKVAELDIPNLFSPNGDQINDQFAIELTDDRERDFREAYLSNELLVFDRWGKKVYSTENYKSKDWDGARLSDGTYFYILKLTGQFSDEVKRGSVTILRGP